MRKAGRGNPPETVRYLGNREDTIRRAYLLGKVLHDHVGKHPPDPTTSPFIHRLSRAASCDPGSWVWCPRHQVRSFPLQPYSLVNNRPPTRQGARTQGWPFRAKKARGWPPQAIKGRRMASLGAQVLHKKRPQGPSCDKGAPLRLGGRQRSRSARV